MDFWVSYDKFSFKKREIVWVLRHLGEMSEGRWPTNPEGGTYLESPLSSKTRRHHADFENSTGIAGEIEARLKECKLDMYLIYGFYQYFIPPEKLAIVAQMSVREVERRIIRALNYVSQPDFWEERTSYEEFIK